jgi:membrane protease YdiL (CAAX protease family)
MNLGSPAAPHDNSRQRAAGVSMPLRLWHRLPVPARSLLSGLFVFFVLQNGWASLFILNSRVLPTVPWSVPIGLLWLWLIFRYFNGRGWPESTAKNRRQAMGAQPPTSTQWLWSLAYFPLFFAFLTALINVVYRFVVIPEDNYDLSMFPWWSLYPCLVMLSVNAGVSEEAGFRGYMQGGLEKRYGPAVAIGITSITFWLVHFNHASGPARAALLVGMSVGLGALTYCAGSIWPAIVTHASLDTIVYIAGASGLAPWFLQQPAQISETGVDLPFIFFSALLIVSAVGSAIVLVRLRRSQPPLRA